MLPPMPSRKLEENAAENATQPWPTVSPHDGHRENMAQDHDASTTSNENTSALSDTESLLEESTAHTVLPALPTHFPSISVGFHYIISSILSSLFLIVYVLFASILKSIPRTAWSIWSWCHFRDPNRVRPFYEEEKTRRNIQRGEIRDDIGYYANRVGLTCDEIKVETEDGFILTMHHIIDRTPGAVDSKSTISSSSFLFLPRGQADRNNFRKLSCFTVTWITTIFRDILCQ